MSPNWCDLSELALDARWSRSRSAYQNDRRQATDFARELAARGQLPSASGLRNGRNRLTEYWAPESITDDVVSASVICRARFHNLFMGPFTCSTTFPHVITPLLSQFSCSVELHEFIRHRTESFVQCTSKALRELRMGNRPFLSEKLPRWNGSCPHRLSRFNSPQRGSAVRNGRVGILRHASDGRKQWR